MRACVQVVRRAKVTLPESNNEIAGEIRRGLLVLLGVGLEDGPEQVRTLARKVAGMRVFEDENGKMNLDVGQVDGKILVVSQFTLYADCRHGKRPGFADAAPPERANVLYEAFCAELRSFGLTVETGRFRNMMLVELVNDGPVTIWLDSDSL